MPIHEHGRRLALDRHGMPERTVPAMCEQAQRVADRGRQIERGALELGIARIRDQLRRESPTLLHRGADAMQSLAFAWIRRVVRLEHVEVPHHHRQQVVDVVRDTLRELRVRTFEPLLLRALLLERATEPIVLDMQGLDVLVVVGHSMSPRGRWRAPP